MKPDFLDIDKDGNKIQVLNLCSFNIAAAGRQAAKEFIKRLGPKAKDAKITNTKPPNVKITQGPRRLDPKKPNQPVNPKTGKFQKPSKPPAVKKPKAKAEKTK